MSDTTPFEPGTFSRRQWLGGAAALAATFLARPAFAAGPNVGKGRVMLVEHSKATLDASKLDDAVVKQMVAEGLKAFTGEATAAAALGRFFKANQKIAIKVNALGNGQGNVGSAVSPQVALALAGHLVELGVKKSNIRIFDQYMDRMKKAGYRHQKPEDGIWVTGHEGPDANPVIYDDNGYKVTFHWAKSQVWADAVLNLCVPKDHNLTGVTGALKNMSLGVVRPTPAGEKQPNGYTVVPRFHRNNCDPAIAKLYAMPMIKDKVKLIVCDATRVLYQGGPQDNPRNRVQNNQLYVTTDPVAMDVLIHELVNKHRVAKGLPKVEDATPRPRAPKFIQTAAKMGLGEGDRAKIVVDTKKLG